MRAVLYLDVYFLLNTALSAVSLLCASRILSARFSWWRWLLSALWGGVVSTLVLFLSPPPALLLLVGLASPLPAVWFTFGKTEKKRFFLLCFFTLVSGLVLGGVCETVFYYASFFGSSSERLGLGLFLFLVFFSLGAFSMWGKRLRKKMDSAVVSMSVRKGERVVEIYALVDSACFLEDPASGTPVVLVKAPYAGELLSEEAMALLRSGQIPPDMVSIPMATAAGRGEVVAFRPDETVLFAGIYKKNHKKVQVLIAVDFTCGGFAGCPGLIPLGVL